MAGYVRQDVSDNIANGNVIDADDLDLEFDAVAAAFNSSTGHAHDGTSGEGARILTIGPAGDIIGSALSLTPKADGTYLLGSPSLQWENAYIAGITYTGSINLGGTAVTATAAELNLLDGLTSSTAELNILDGATVTTAELNVLDGIPITLTATELGYLDGVTSAVQTQLNVKQPLDAGLTSISALTTAADRMIYTTGPDIYAVTPLTTAGRALLDDASAAAQLITLGLTATATELNILDGVTATASELNILDGATLSTTELNYVDGVTSNIQSQINSKQNANANLTAIAGLIPSGFLSIVGGVGYHRDILGTTNQITVTNGDGSVGDPTISAVVASQAEAEAGTDTIKLMTAQRVAQAVTTDRVLAATAAASFGAIGTYVMAYYGGAGITEGTIVAGSSLQPAGMYAVSLLTDDLGLDGGVTKGGTALSGNWRLMGRVNLTSGSSYSRVSLFLRVS